MATSEAGVKAVSHRDLSAAGRLVFVHGSLIKVQRSEESAATEETEGFSHEEG